MEQIHAIIEEVCNPSRIERLPNDDFVRLEKCIKEFSASYVYTHRASHNDPLSAKARESMTRNVKSLACRNLLGGNIRKNQRNTEKFVDDDQQILNLARDELKKNKSTSKPAILHRRLSAFIKSIGRISCGKMAGTCWIVSGTLVITCHHVYRSFIEERNKRSNSTLPIEVSFDYFYSKQSEHIRTVKVDEDHDPQIESSHLDYKFLRLKENEALRDRDGLGQFVRNRSSQEGLVTIVGHPGGNEMREETCVVIRNFLWREQLEERQKNSTGLHMTSDDRLRANRYEEQGCLPYDTTLFSGSSGSPVFYLNGNIVAMHTQGYTPKIDERCKCSLMEFGVQFSAICEDLRRRNFNPEDYFPHYILGPNEERMDEDSNQ